MKKSKIILPVAFLFILFSCEQSNNYKSEQYATEETISSEVISVDSATQNEEVPLSSTAATHQDPNRKFIRTADFSMEVENVYQSTTQIENKLSQIGGFVTQSNLESNIISNEKIPMNADSATQVKKYTVSNRMTVRVPQLELGHFLTSLGEEMQFLNYRNIAAQDVSLNFVMAELEKERLEKTSEKLDKINSETGKIKDKQNIVNNVDEKQGEIIQSKISTLKMKDEVAYSSVTLLLSEKEKIAESMVINP